MSSPSGADWSGQARDPDGVGVSDAEHVDRYADARRRYRWFVLGIALLAVVAALTVVPISLPDSDDGASTGSSTWVRLVLLVTGGLMIVFGLVATVRLQMWSLQAWSPLRTLERAERRSAQRQVQGREPVDHTRLVLLRAVARHQRTQWPAAVWPAGLLMINLSNLLDDSSLLVALLSGAAVLLLVSSLPVVLLQYVLATRFLRDHPETDRGTA